MDFGCRIWDEDGNLILNTADYTARLVYWIVLDGYSSGSVYIPEADGKMPFVCVFPFWPTYYGICLSVGISPSGVLTWDQVLVPIAPQVFIGSEGTAIFVYVCDEKV